ncbi:hypothetical protein UFOVP860_29 [uncultured Caudovirales phage]|uniref:Uncharacterized protein n=1 Tax=uncultured Caudovirales phage TaxID=2100421 RepID=A0A6J5RJI7_9CAUD|nr:hypothetical protein UFOVP860_29 [uncultured Caudovirales phage]CAB4196152.1 hypothetical protein UFOVP1293_82 [uncultured Caudovirales phage]CAB4222278.1 hypothetical protein UFOVP1644_5 [uncultured Caudovirales phage]
MPNHLPPRPEPALSDDQLAEAKRLYLVERLSTYRVAARLGLGQEAVRTGLLRAGVVLRFGAAAQTATVAPVVKVGAE